MPDDDARLLALAASSTARSYLAIRGTGVYVVRPDGHIVWASPSMGDVTGFAPADLVGKNAWGMFVPPEGLPAMAEFRAKLSVADGTVWASLVTAGGKRAWIRADAVMRDGGILVAMRRETDPAEQHAHTFMRPARPAGR